MCAFLVVIEYKKQFTLNFFSGAVLVGRTLIAPLGILNCCALDVVAFRVELVLLE